MKYLFIDDERIPKDKTHDWDIVRNYNQFKEWIDKNGVPDFVSFDHDLADFGMNGAKMVERNGKDCAMYLIDYCIENEVKFPKYNVHSANPVGAENIYSLIQNYKKYFEA